MKLLIIRHAIAKDRDEFAATGRPDCERPLTRRGCRRMRSNAAGVAQVAGAVDRLLASPYARAVETARIVGAALGVTNFETLDALAQDHDPNEFLLWLATQPASFVAIIGHEPQLGRLIALCTGGGGEAFVELKKGAACLIDFSSEVPQPGEGRMVWLLQPSQLRAIAG